MTRGIGTYKDNERHGLQIGEPQTVGKGSQLVHDLKNCLSVLLMNLGTGEARDSRTIEETIFKMNCLLEELAQLHRNSAP